MTLETLNTLPAADAEREFTRCCGSSRWAVLMTVARPFQSAEAMALTADVVWGALGRADWLEAFAAHPRIGDRPHVGHTATAGWAAQEQSGVGDSTRARLLQLNRDYEARFGYIFIVCAAGKSGTEMVAILERRLTNDPAEELREAAEQQRRITRLRLGKLLT